jgi:hypothetical protein
LADQHPFASIFDNRDDSSQLAIQYPYFHHEIITTSGGQDYAYPSYKNVHDNAEWIHTIDSIISALVEAGLQIEFFHEHSACPWQMFPFCEHVGPGLWHIRGDLIPLIFSLGARKPRLPA